MAKPRDGIQRFFRYARARHQIYLDRVAGKPRPWTKDKILDTYRFTNVFRELDKTTKWFADYVRDPLRDKPEVLLATVVFRLLNRIEVGEAIFCQTDIATRGSILGFKHGTAFDLFLATGKTAHLKHAIVANCGAGPYVTGAYIISSPAGYSKLDGMMEVIKRFHTGSREWKGLGAGIMDTMNWGGEEGAAEMMLANRGDVTLESAWEWLRQFDYFGPFHAYEVVTDLRHTALLDRSPDILTWANPGPGARRGLNRTFGRDKSTPTPRDQLIDEMRILVSWSRDKNMWPQDDKKNWPAWEMREAEHQSCEWDKYCRVLNGEGKPRGVYR